MHTFVLRWGDDGQIAHPTCFNGYPDSLTQVCVGRLTQFIAERAPTMGDADAGWFGGGGGAGGIAGDGG